MLIRKRGHDAGRIITGDNVWIGVNVVILANVEVEMGAVIGAGSVVNTNIFPYAVVGGVPAKQFGRRA